MGGGRSSHARANTFGSDGVGSGRSRSSARMVAIRARVVSTAVVRPRAKDQQTVSARCNSTATSTAATACTAVIVSEP